MAEALAVSGQTGTAFHERHYDHMVTDVAGAHSTLGDMLVLVLERRLGRSGGGLPCRRSLFGIECGAVLQDACLDAHRLVSAVLSSSPRSGRPKSTLHNAEKAYKRYRDPESEAIHL